ncbi:CaiB/BaiF CoA transferase family protein [Maricaulis sp.]|uniref:CaiB/BaiF CoA transferase family protein n=1 Tax=Maricaulis sp. TaxID=1486257 RepID=UPI003A94D229
MTQAVDNKPLAGLKVLELARVLAGPWIGQTLADLGADVIKVEAPLGDDTRHWGPPWVKHESGASSAYYHSCNRGKRSIALDFTKPEDRDLVLELVDGADVLVENFKVGGLAKYGLDYDSLKVRNPRLVYCSVTGFGQTGPYAHRAGYDLMIQAMSGIMDLTGEPDRPPQRLGVAFADIFTGVYGVIGVQAALAQREKTGLGQHVDMALLDSMMGVLGNQAMNYLTTGVAPHRLGNSHPNIVPYQEFAASDGHIILACGNDGQFERLCTLLDFPPDVLVRNRTNAERAANRSELVAQIADAMARFTRDDLLAALEQEGIPAGPINTVEQAFNDVQAQHRGLATEADGIPGIRNPIRLSGIEVGSGKRSPGLDEHGAGIRERLWD